MFEANNPGTWNVLCLFLERLLVLDVEFDDGDAAAAFAVVSQALGSYQWMLFEEVADLAAEPDITIITQRLRRIRRPVSSPTPASSNASRLNVTI